MRTARPLLATLKAFSMKEMIWRSDKKRIVSARISGATRILFAKYQLLRDLTIALFPRSTERGSIEAFTWTTAMPSSYYPIDLENIRVVSFKLNRGFPMRCDNLWQSMIGTILILAWLVAVRGSALGAIIDVQSDRAAERITIVSNARLRMSPQATEEEVARLPLGTIVLVLDQSAAKEKIGSIEDFWYHVKTADGKSGWLFGGLTTPFSTTGREEIYRHIAAERLKTARKDFFEQVDLFKFLTRAIAEVKAPVISAELELSQLIALSNSLRAIPFNQRPREPRQPYASWVKLHEAHIVYSDPAGMWLVKSERFWELEKKYHALPIGERITWTAAQNELPGECEGFIHCYFARMSMREGTYLKLHPNGAHAGEAISKIDELLRYFNHDIQFLQRQMQSELSPEDRSRFKKEIADFREVLVRITSPKKSALLKELDQLSLAIP